MCVCVCVCVCVCLFLSVEILECLVVFMSIYTVCNFSACEIIKYSDSDSDSECSAEERYNCCCYC